MKNKNVLGAKYFRYLDNGELEVIRVIGYVDTETVKVKFENSGVIKKIKYEEMIKYYFKLNPDGALITSNLKINVDNKHAFYDVGVLLYKYEELKEDPKALPYVVCRQNISDLFTNMQNTNGKQYMGCSVSRDSIPTDVPFQGLLCCDNVEENTVVEVYLTDTLDDILQCIKTKPYDMVLTELFNQSIKQFNAEDQKVLRKVGCNCGYMTTLKDLLSINNFMLDFNACFGIIKFDIDFKIIGNQLTNNQLILIESVFNTRFLSHYIIKYDRDVLTANIKKGRYILIKDVHDKTFILSYTSDMEINPKNIEYSKLVELSKSTINTKL